MSLMTQESRHFLFVFFLLYSLNNIFRSNMCQQVHSTCLCWCHITTTNQYLCSVRCKCYAVTFHHHYHSSIIIQHQCHQCRRTSLPSRITLRLKLSKPRQRQPLPCSSAAADGEANQLQTAQHPSVAAATGRLAVQQVAWQSIDVVGGAQGRTKWRAARAFVQLRRSVTNQYFAASKTTNDSHCSVSGARRVPPK